MNAMANLPENEKIVANNGTAIAMQTKRTKMLLGLHTVQKINAQGRVETVTHKIPDEIY